MLRSFSYAAVVALLARATVEDPVWEHLLPYGDPWAEVHREALWYAYVGTVVDAGVLPHDNAVHTARRAFEARRASPGGEGRARWAQRSWVRPACVTKTGPRAMLIATPSLSNPSSLHRCRIWVVSASRSS